MKGYETTEKEDDLFPRKMDHPLLNRQRAYHQQKQEERENEKREKYESGTVSFLIGRPTVIFSLALCNIVSGRLLVTVHNY